MEETEDSSPAVLGSNKKPNLDSESEMEAPTNLSFRSTRNPPAGRARQPLRDRNSRIVPVSGRQTDSRVELISDQDLAAGNEPDQDAEPEMEAEQAPRTRRARNIPSRVRSREPVEPNDELERYGTDMEQTPVQESNYGEDDAVIRPAGR